MKNGTKKTIDSILQSMIILCDTREKPTDRFIARMEMTGLPYKRQALNVGDYSCAYTMPDGEIIDFSHCVSIERKMNIDELCMCFGSERARFTNEFDRAREHGTKVYLIVEDATWEKIYNGRYSCHFHPNALVASINAFRSTYNMQLDFCKAEITGKLIRDILYRELKHFLEVVYNEKHV